MGTSSTIWMAAVWSLGVQHVPLDGEFELLPWIQLKPEPGPNSPSPGSTQKPD